ncbi:unconventional myosin-XV isoform X2 [Ochlerotatus camptorhynchus]|uniref:unconventional myosin-XV isoform X2 n=1 Tax=Ochlerotatus camptorhynchus TaxID=644619 RepID=UPI0031E1F430
MGPTDDTRVAEKPQRTYDQSSGTSSSSYKCYEGIPTPSPISPAESNFVRNYDHGNNSSQHSRSINHESDIDTLHRPASLDSLVNLPEQTSNMDDKFERLSDSDSMAEICEITGETRVDIHRRSDLDDLQDVLPMDEPVIKAYLEKSHVQCEYINCGFKKDQNSQNTIDVIQEDSELSDLFKASASTASTSAANLQSSVKNRRNSIASSGSVGRMETIIEEPIEPKVSVKEILARFETLRESAETQTKGPTISSGVRAAAATLNVPLERLEISNNSPSSPNQLSPAEKSHRSSTIDYDNMHLENGLQPQQQDIPSSPNNQNNYGHHGHYKVSVSSMGNNYAQGGHIMQHEESSPTQTSLTKHSLLQFAMQHFRNDGEEFKKNDNRGSTRNPLAEMVKWQGNPLRLPLLRLPPDLAPLAIECFDCILRYCGDLIPDPELTEVKCVYTVLMHCHKHLTLRDEVYCQLIKQTTANRSTCPESAQRAWRLLSILAAYFGCSDALRPYLIEHLTSAASDRRRACHGTAAVCLTNLRKTARCGGRKNVPSVEEVTAVSAGRSARRQIYRLPGGAERIVNTRCSTVVGDVITELCSLLGIEIPAEQQEFSLYCIVQGDAFTMPLAADEYILDVTTELLKSGQPFYLIFCRSVWHFPLKRDPAPTPLYIEVLFNQVAPDYLEGLLLELPNGGAPTPDYVRDMARIAAILHRAADLNHLPAMKEIKFLLPKPALSLRELRPAQWVALVQSAWPSIAGLSPIQVKAQFLNVLSSWPLFGSSFFAVKRVWSEETPAEEVSPMWRELILALNRRGVLFLDPNTHETMQHWPFNEVISTRKVRSEDGALFLDMKVGNLLQQRVIRVQTEQAHEISRLVRQYITMAQAQLRDRRE